jgi:hypothetical protein
MDDELEELNAMWQHEQRESRLSKYETWIQERARVRKERLSAYDEYLKARSNGDSAE